MNVNNQPYFIRVIVRVSLGESYRCTRHLCVPLIGGIKPVTQLVACNTKGIIGVVLCN